MFTTLLIIFKLWLLYSIIGFITGVIFGIWSTYSSLKHENYKNDNIIQTTKNYFWGFLVSGIIFSVLFNLIIITYLGGFTLYVIDKVKD